MVYLGFILMIVATFGCVISFLNNKAIESITYFFIVFIGVGMIIYDKSSPVELDNVEYYYSNTINDQTFNNITLTSECAIIKRSYVATRPLSTANNRIEYIISCPKN